MVFWATSHRTQHIALMSAERGSQTLPQTIIGYLCYNLQAEIFYRSLSLSRLYSHPLSRLLTLVFVFACPLTISMSILSFTVAVRRRL